MSQQTEDTSGKSLPQKYAKRAGGNEPPRAEELRLLVQGPVGCGKTQWAASAPKVALLDFENKARHVRSWGSGSTRFYFSKGKDYDALFDDLVSDGLAGKAPFDLIVWDTMLSWIKLRREQLTRTYRQQNLLKGLGDITNYGKGGSGWDALNQAVIAPIGRLYDAGYGWIALSHLMPVWRKTDDAGSKATKGWEWVLNQGVLRYLYSQCDYALTMDYDTQMMKGEKGGYVKRKVFTLSTEPPDGIPGRTLIPLGEGGADLKWPVPAEKGWESFSGRYDEARKRWMEQTP